MVRYALAETLRGDNSKWAFRFEGKGNLKVRLAKLWIERRMLGENSLLNKR